MRFQTLDDWLSWQEGLHPSEIDLGLARVNAVWQRLGGGRPAPNVVTVAGTNGKGSCVAMLESIYRAAGYRVGAYTSPHILKYNERVRVNGENAPDEAFCRAFAAIDAARAQDGDEISLTYFEFGTLAAFYIFAEAGVDVAILEVGLGGRLDAVNIIDTDVALIATIDLDHAAWLGNTREAIGREKAGIMRAGRPAICADLNPPSTISAVAQETGAQLYLLHRDFSYEQMDAQWRWHWGERSRHALPLPALRGDYQLRNASAVLLAVELLSDRLPLGQTEIRNGLTQVTLPGRFQVLPGETPVILDVAHNPEAARALRQNMRSWPMPGKVCAIVAMMGDKDIAEVLSTLAEVVDEWHVTTFDLPRAASAERLQQVLSEIGETAVTAHPSVAEAMVAVSTRVEAHDRVLVFGSFYTVAGALAEAYNGPSAKRT